MCSVRTLPLLLCKTGLGRVPDFRLLPATRRVDLRVPLGIGGLLPLVHVEVGRGGLLLHSIASGGGLLDSIGVPSGSIHRGGLCLHAMPLLVLHSGGRLLLLLSLRGRSCILRGPEVGAAVPIRL